MAKKQLTPEEKVAQEAKAKAEQEAAAAQANAEGDAGTTDPIGENPKDEKESGDISTEMRKRIEQAFKEFPTSDQLYYDGNDLFFAQVKSKMTVLKRTDFITN